MADAGRAPGASKPGVLKECPEPLWGFYDLAMLDLDGVVYIGGQAVPGVAENLAAAVAAGMRTAFVTNNASRPPDVVAEHLRRLGVPARVEDVVTSAQAAARVIAERVAPGAPVFVIGGEGLYEALRERGLRPTQDVRDDPVAVVSGYGPDLRWRTVSDGAILVRQGLPWVASNTDMTVPTPRGPGPGNGVLVRAVAEHAAVTPVVAGKPEPPLFHETQERVGGRRPLVVGDRLDTDIEGATRAGYDSLLVMTGVTGLRELVSAPRQCRPTYVGSTLASLGRPHQAPRLADGRWTVAGWQAAILDGRLVMEGAGDTDAWLAAAAASSWEYLDGSGVAPDIASVSLPGPRAGSLGR